MVNAVQPCSNRNIIDEPDAAQKCCRDQPPSLSIFVKGLERSAIDVGDIVDRLESIPD
jgi:hypothetical protein